MDEAEEDAPETIAPPPLSVRPCSVPYAAIPSSISCHRHTAKWSTLRFKQLGEGMAVVQQNGCRGGAGGKKDLWKSVGWAMLGGGTSRQPSSGGGEGTEKRHSPAATQRKRGREGLESSGWRSECLKSVALGESYGRHRWKLWPIRWPGTDDDDEQAP